MKSDNMKIMDTFTLKNIPDLDVCVLAALELFTKEKIPKIKIPYKRPLVVGSGNAAITGRIIFEKRDAIFADESNYEKKLKNIKVIDGVVLISASGGKHAPIIAKISKKFKKHISLITGNPEALAKKYLDGEHKYDLYVFPKNREPYTYNTSIYLGMIFGITHENPEKILNQIKKIKIPDFRKYDAFYILIPGKFEEAKEMFLTKFDELFGSKISGRVFTSEQTKHAKTLVPSDKELFICVNTNPKQFSKNFFRINLSKKANYGELMATLYYLIGHIQKQNIPYFKNNISSYAKKTSKIFRQEINPIVK